MNEETYKVKLNREGEYVVEDVTKSQTVRVIAAKGANFEPTIVSELPEAGDSSKLYLTPKDAAKTTVTGGSLNITTASGKDVLVAPAAILGEAEQDTAVAPTPDNPQAINYVTGDQTVTIQGKNLVHAESRTDSGVTIEYDSDTGDIHLSGTSTQGWTYLTAQNVSCSIPAGTYRLTTDVATSNYNKTVRLFHAGGGYTSVTILAGFTSASVTLARDVSAYYVAVVYQDNFRTPDDTFKLQLEAGSESTEIVPYHNESITLPLGNTHLRRVGDYADKIAKINNAWMVERNTAIGALTGSESWIAVDADFYTPSLLGERPMSEIHIISSKLLGIPRADIGGNQNYITMSSDGNIRVNIAGVTSTNDLVSLLESNNIDYYYGLLVPEYEAIEDTTLLEQLELLEALHVDKEGTTAISLTATGVAGELEITYYEVEPEDKYDGWIYVGGEYERIDAESGLVPEDGGYVLDGEANSSNAIWTQWNNRLAFGMNTATAPVPAQFNGQIFADGTIIAHNTGDNSHNRWGFHVFEAYDSGNYNRITMLVDKHTSEYDSKKSAELYYYTGSNHAAASYGYFKLGSDVAYHSFLFSRDKMIASGEIDCRFPVTLARISPSDDLDDTCNTVAAADAAYEPESSATNNLKCIKYLALKNAEDGCMWYDTDRNKVVVKINGAWHDLNTTVVPDGTYNF